MTRTCEKARGGGSGVGVPAAVLALAAFVGGCGGWQGELDRELPVMGHRNWIVVADSAYPAQTAEGIKVVATGARHLAVVRAALKAVDDAPHVRPVIYVDSEMKYVSQQDAPGIEAYREALDGLLEKRGVMAIPHDELIAKLAEAAGKFRVLVLKTNFTLPYTSVFIELDCGYWGADSEKRLRKAIGAAASAASRVVAPTAPAKPGKGK